MQYLNRAMHEKGYQESSVDKYSTTTQLCRSHQSSSSCDLQVRRLSRPSQGIMVFRHDDSAGHHIKNSVGPFRHDESSDRSQRAKECSSQRNQAQYSTTQLSKKLKMERNHLPKAAKEHKNYDSTIAEIHEHCNNFVLPKYGDSTLQTSINRTLQRRRSQRYQSCSKRQRKTTAIDGIRVRMNSTNRGLSGMKIKNIRSHSLASNLKTRYDIVLPLTTPYLISTSTTVFCSLFAAIQENT
ncbi:hypothetical protein F511_35632 [Dorcoceras hygrometricum]|uniref:Uncharacterized protein n=1 Tax=Dorcoceras hygrometricum TaxID=472368 RepID=A0A2Z7CJU3_9LAMI|nr:hypothetical protein F511_35632 [Dorcoceras hygrometricum]